VAPGEKKEFTFKALTPGIYIYHGASGNVGFSMASGMYGLMLVEPKKGLEKVDREFYVTQGEFFTEGPIGAKGLRLFSPERFLREDPAYVVFNGRVNALLDRFLSAKVGEKIRIYFGNASVIKVSSFHIIGEILDRVYLHGSFLNPPMLGVQTTLVPAGGAAAIELKLDYPADYILVDHSLARLDKGAFGVLRVSGEKNPEIFSSPYLDSSSDRSGH
jgi:nitrite reductase (NO-forming)